MLENYLECVNTVKNTNLTDEVRMDALRSLLRFYKDFKKQDAQKAMKYTKNALLTLFKSGILRGLTEDLKGLKPLFIELFNCIDESDMHAFAFTQEEKHSFWKLRNKLKNEVGFTVSSNESGKQNSQEQVNEICAEGLDDNIVSLKGR